MLVGVGGRLEDKNPPVANLTTMRVLSTVGQDVRISCPIHGNPAPYIEWSRQGEIIDYTWVKYKTHKKLLKIKDVVREDTGVIICKGINGFGSTQVKIELYVSSSKNQEVAPILTDMTLNMNTLYKKLVGQSFSLACDSLGVPQPNITWYHGSRRISDSARLVIPAVHEQNSGEYTCLARNRAGSSKRQFYLTVESPHVELPVILYTSNITVYQGQMVVLECQVESSLTPEVQWLQEGVEEEYSITLGAMRLVSAGYSELVASDTHKYQSTFAVDNARETQMYVCLATNPAGGFSYRKSFLTVLPVFYLDYLPVLVICLVGAVIMLILIVTCLIRSRQKLLLSQYQSSYSTHIYDVPHYSPVSLSDTTASTPLSTRHSTCKTNSPRTLTYNNRSLPPAYGVHDAAYGVHDVTYGVHDPMRRREQWDFIGTDYPEYSDLKLI